MTSRSARPRRGHGPITLAITLAIAGVLAVTGCGSASTAGVTTPRTAVPGTAAPGTAVPSTAAPGTAGTPSPEPPAESATVAPPVAPPVAPTAEPSVAPTAGSSWPATGIPGVNDPDCRSTEPPVVLLHGFASTIAANFAPLVTALRGRCVFAMPYGTGGFGPIRDSARAEANFTDRVLAVTGAAQVDVVAYSEGGLVLRTALRLDSLAPRVRVAVLVAPAFHGTTTPLVTAVPAALCPACADLAAGSPLLVELDHGGDLDGAVRYAVISTERDTVVTPVSSQVPAGPADRVRSVVVEDRCPDLVTNHVDLPGEPAVVGWVVAAMDTDGRPPADALHCH